MYGMPSLIQMNNKIKDEIEQYKRWIHMNDKIKDEIEQYKRWIRENKEEGMMLKEHLFDLKQELKEIKSKQKSLK
jgi:hypothetical protein